MIFVKCSKSLPERSIPHFTININIQKIEKIVLTEKNIGTVLSIRRF